MKWRPAHRVGYETVSGCRCVWVCVLVSQVECVSECECGCTCVSGVCVYVQWCVCWDACVWSTSCLCTHLVACQGSNFFVWGVRICSAQMCNYAFQGGWDCTPKENLSLGPLRLFLMQLER